MWSTLYISPSVWFMWVYSWLCWMISVSVSPLSQHVHHLCQQCSPGSVCDAAVAADANARPSDQSRPRRIMWMMQERYLSVNIHHVQCAPDECQTSIAREGKVKGCQERSLPDELNKCFMNFKQLAVCPPAVFKRPKVQKEKQSTG